MRHYDTSSRVIPATRCPGFRLIVPGTIRITFLALTAALLLAACQAQPPDPLDELIDIGSHRLHIDCRGQGAPTVIVDVGIGESAESWLALQDRLAPHARVCTYERAGYVPSEPGPFPRDSGRVAGELNALLEAAGEKGPFVLVGHSLGGLNVQVYASRYSDQVAGMVLLDPPPLSWLLGEDYPDLRQMAVQQIATWRGQAAEAAQSTDPDAQASAAFLHTLASEHEELFGQSARLAADIDTFGQIPLVVVASGKPNAGFGDVAGEYQRYWAGESRKLAAKSGRSQFVLAEQSSHHLHRDEPGLVVDAILSVVNGAIGTSTPLEETMSNPIKEPPSTPLAGSPIPLGEIIPRPVSVTPAAGVFTLPASADIYVEPGSPEMIHIGQSLARILNASTGYGLQVLPAAGPPAEGTIYLTTAGGDPALGEEGYELTITPDLVTLTAHQPAGLFRGIQTIRQLLPPSIEHSTPQPGPWRMASGTIRDYPRFPWRGAMLDVARHFFAVEDVKRIIDLLAYYKMNRFHMHLSDDQGWRIVIDSWPELATHSGSTEVGGGPGGYYTQAEYAGIVAYAQERYIDIIPEIDMPGHTNAALASYAELNCDGVAPPLYTGIKVGFSSLCVDKGITYTFVDDVVRQLAALTPGDYIHVGGDETEATSAADYERFIERVQAIVESHGKKMAGWEEVAQIPLSATSVVQHWHSDLAQRAIQQGAKVIMSPASRTYLDMKYDAATPLGQDWAGIVNVQDAYTWDPATQVDGVSEGDILGVEAALWSETIETIDDIEFMTFPRLPGHAEIGWSPAAGRSWDEYRIRLATHGPRLSAMGINYYRSPLVPWK